MTTDVTDAGGMGLDVDALGNTDPILSIAEEVFSAMIDGEPGLLNPWYGDRPDAVDPMYAWVDVHEAGSGRVLIEAERTTVVELTRALLAMGADEEVTEADMVDGLGEVANVVGGNVKALVPETGVLTLPQVSSERPPSAAEDLVHELALDWRGRLVVLSLWRLP